MWTRLKTRNIQHQKLTSKCCPEDEWSCILLFLTVFHIISSKIAQNRPIFLVLKLAQLYGNHGNQGNSEIVSWNKTLFHFLNLGMHFCLINIPCLCLQIWSLNKKYPVWMQCTPHLLLPDPKAQTSSEINIKWPSLPIPQHFSWIKCRSVLEWL